MLAPPIRVMHPAIAIRLLTSGLRRHVPAVASSTGGSTPTPATASIRRSDVASRHQALPEAVA